MMHQFNQTMDYLEQQLTGEVDMKRFQQLSGYSYPLFSRLFSILADMTLAEYLRNRRLSEAVTDLRESSEKVIDIALKYGYDSADAFSAAFKKFHGATPSEVRNGKPYRVFPRLQLSLKITGGKNMDIKIQKKPAFTVAGVLLEAIDNSQCPSAWEQLYANHSLESLEGFGSGQSFGVCSDVKEGEIIDYMAAYDVTDKVKAEELGLSIKDISEAEYAIVPVKGPIPASIHHAWKYVLEIFFPETGYRHSGAPDFEVYTGGDMSSPDYQMELWIPVIKE
ncbi:AraC family transcriptional regulator [Streptococcus mitis]|uniref:Transcriptional regulator, effector binding domain protein n=1 Tax=Streptococcus mitis ATCC 6249 TaxID=864567 RepID=E0PRG7_STRMT|nr:AraC family transcriptional regulator [Streptococcus mitis]EFM31718.1 transcriptional regulator, effector binding domain protein [Streptococcus mitis ATCC 6249]